MSPSASDPSSRSGRGRALYRVVYPAPDRPRLVLEDGATGRVLDCSERGLRYRPDPGQRPPAFGAVVAGRVELQRGEPAEVSGRVIRVSDGDVALRLEAPGLPLRAIFDEQRALRARYLFGDPARGGGAS
jgi:hypothetical protein